MTKFLVVICILFSLAAASQECIYTAPLKILYGFSEASYTMASPKAYSNLNYCTSLKSSACCTDTDINKISSISDEYTKNLTALVSTRDTYINTAKTTVLPTLLTNIQNFNKVATEFLKSFEEIMGSALGGFDMSDLDMSDVNLSDYDLSNYDLSDYDLSNYDLSDLSDYDLSGYDLSDFSDIDIGLDDSDLDGLAGASMLLGMVEAFGYITNITTEFVLNVDSIKSNYGNYQNARRTCVLDMLDVQNSAMCLSCDPSATSKGFFIGAEEDSDDSDSSDEFGGISLGFGIDMSKATCTRLQNSCKPYIALAVGQNQLIEIVQASAGFAGLTTAMQSFIDGKYDVAMEQIFTAINETESTALLNAVPALIPGALPESCNTNGDCEWICEGMFISGFVNPYALLIGGEPGSSFDEEENDERRRLASASASANRKLESSGEWAPTKGDSGVTVNFAADPAGTNESGKKFGSLNLGNVFVGMMVVISSILLF